MTRYSIARRTTNVTIANACLEIIAGAKRVKVVSVEVMLAAATASVFGLGRPAAKGITPTTPISMLPDAAGDAGESTVTTAIAWGTGPTVPAQFIRRCSFLTAIGAIAYWEFVKGLWIPANGSIVLWNISATSAVDVNVVVEE